jgi:DmsE family decaheme c-type cytochrome
VRHSRPRAQRALFVGILVAALHLATAWALASERTRTEPQDSPSASNSRPASDSLPATDMAASESVRQHPEGFPSAPGFSHAAVAENPQAPDAKSVGERVCIACHQLENEHFSHTLHASGLRAAARGTLGAPVCEACHGPGSAHAQHPTEKGLIIGFTHDSGTPVVVQTQTCLTCHGGGPREHWLASVHQRNGLSCSDCHNPMQKASVEGLLARNSINEVCSTCHRDIRVQFNRRSHMPLPEGQMACVDCHNPHGALTAPLLKTNTVNETCYQCHAEKRGPFLFEHAPVRESCLNCHAPHGSNQATLLVAPIPFLCQQCHTQLRHPNDLQTPQSLGTGLHPVSGSWAAAASPVMRRSTARTIPRDQGFTSSAGSPYA